MKRTYTYVLVGLVAAFFAHLVISLAFSSAASHLYQHRMINVRNLDSRPELRPALVEAFLFDNLTNEKRRTVVVVGSSFSWGYSWHETGVFTWHMQESLGGDYKVVNASVIGDSPGDSLDTVCRMERLGLHVDVLVLEFSMNNFARTAESERVAKPGRRECSPDVGPRARPSRSPPYLAFFFENPFGLAHLRLLWDEYNYVQPERAFSFGPLADTYFESRSEFDADLGHKRRLVDALLDTAARVSTRQIALIAPINEKGVQMSQFDWKEVVRQLRSLEATCREHASAECLPLMLDLGPGYFSNLTHLNLAGHEFLGSYLSGRVSKQ